MYSLQAAEGQEQRNPQRVSAVSAISKGGRGSLASLPHQMQGCQQNTQQAG